MRQAQVELLDWQGLGCSVMELSHRSAEFIALAEQAEQDLRDLLAIPRHYKVLFCQGGGRGQFAAVPLNLTSSLGHSADYAVTGSWSKAALKEASSLLVAHHANADQTLDVARWQSSEDTAYFHYCENETVDGIELNQIPTVGAPLVVDMSSNILSRPVDIERFGLIYAGAQKNIGPAGLALVIVREDLLGQARSITPQIMNYQTLAIHRSMYNTPPTFAWYLAGLVFKWIKDQGGVTEMAKRSQAKSRMLYQEIDSSDFYQNTVPLAVRSRMNIPFQLADASLDKLFLQQAEASGLKALAGHRSVGGMRASLYNAMPLEGVQVLVDFMADFEQRYG